jgi:dihydroflavonol-4-reductase
MTGANPSSHMPSAFVTGATGLLGNNLVRALVARGVRVKALARSREKAQRQFADTPSVEIIAGDMSDVAAFADTLRGVDMLFHTAAYFREGYTAGGGDHAAIMQRINVEGTAALLPVAYVAGVRRMVHTSSTVTLYGPRGSLINETMLRAEHETNDYGRSKIRTDREIDRFLSAHPDMFVAFILPGWMMGPGDIGPTSAGQLVMDFVRGKLPGIPPSTFAVTDARDVAEAMIAAERNGRRGERYIAAGPEISMKALFAKLERVSGVRSPTFQVPMPLLYALAGLNELRARVSGKQALINMETARFVASERYRTSYDLSKTTRELGVAFRPVEETLRDVIAWYREHGWLNDAPALKVALKSA